VLAAVKMTTSLVATEKVFLTAAPVETSLSRSLSREAASGKDRRPARGAAGSKRGEQSNRSRHRGDRPRDGENGAAGELAERLWHPFTSSIWSAALAPDKRTDRARGSSPLPSVPGSSGVPHRIGFLKAPCGFERHAKVIVCFRRFRRLRTDYERLADQSNGIVEFTPLSLRDAEVMECADVSRLRFENDSIKPLGFS
jgi:hypothetical protein